MRILSCFMGIMMVTITLGSKCEKGTSKNLDVKNCISCINLKETRTCYWDTISGKCDTKFFGGATETLLGEEAACRSFYSTKDAEKIFAEKMGELISVASTFTMYDNILGSPKLRDAYMYNSIRDTRVISRKSYLADIIYESCPKVNQLNRISLQLLSLQSAILESKSDFKTILDLSVATSNSIMSIFSSVAKIVPFADYAEGVFSLVSSIITLIDVTNKILIAKESNSGASQKHELFMKLNTLQYRTEEVSNSCLKMGVILSLDDVSLKHSRISILADNDDFIQGINDYSCKAWSKISGEDKKCQMGKIFSMLYVDAVRYGEYYESCQGMRDIYIKFMKTLYEGGSPDSEDSRKAVDELATKFADCNWKDDKVVRYTEYGIEVQKRYITGVKN